MSRNPFRHLQAVVWLALAVALSACATINPIGTAQTAEQKAYAAYGTFVVFEEEAAKLVQSSEVPPDVKENLKRADAVAKPAADALVAAARQVLMVRKQLESGATTDDKLRLAIENLNRWYFDTLPKIQALVTLVEKEKA